MINRQAMRGAGTKTTTKATARTKLTKEAGTRTTVKTKGKAASQAKPRPGRTRTEPGGGPAKTATRLTAYAPTPWRADEVSPPSAIRSAEEAAARAEGNEPVRADQAVRDVDHGTYTDGGPARRPRANDPDARENAEEKRQSAAEEHAAMPSRHFPHGRL